MEILKIHREYASTAEGLVVVIDVIRAFTTTAYAFSLGAEKILLVKEVEEAFTLREKYPDAFLVGEVGGAPIKGFDFGNSPMELFKKPLKGRMLILRTSSGTQGVVDAVKAERILTASFVVAQATLERIRLLSPSKVTFVITGKPEGEDKALADYFEHCLKYGQTDPKPYLQRVIDSPEGQIFLSGKFPYFPIEDLEAVLSIDHFPFAMEVFKEDNASILRPVTPQGSIWSNSDYSFKGTVQ